MAMASPDAHPTRESSAISDIDHFQGDAGNGRLSKLFSLSSGDPASFLLHGFQNADLTKRIIEHGGRITDDDSTADVILTKRQDEYKILKDRYAISPKTHVRMSGFVDRCVHSGRFQLAPIVEKGVPGRKLGSRRTEFTADDDEHLCQYIAEVLPDKGEGGRTGHFIYLDLIRRANDFGQYRWAHRHPKDGWRERYRKNQDRLDKRIADIVQRNPPAVHGKGGYASRRFGGIDRDPELNAYDDLSDAGGKGDSATDDEDGPVKSKRTDALREEEEEEGDDSCQAIKYQLGAGLSEHNWDAEQQDEVGDKQVTEHQPEQGPQTRARTRQNRVSLGEAPASKKRRTVAQTQISEKSIFDDIDLTLRGTVIDDKLGGEEPVRSPVKGAAREKHVTRKHPKAAAVALQTTEPEMRTAKPEKPRTRSSVLSSPRRTRARSLSHSRKSPNTAPAPRASSKTKANTKAAGAEATALKPVLESQVSDEFVARSDDESEMDEVEVNLQGSAKSRGGPSANQKNVSSPDDLRTSRYPQDAPFDDAGVADPDSPDSDYSEAELLAHVRKLEVGARSLPTASQKSKGGDPDRRPSEEIFPSPGTHASAEKRRRTEAAKVAPYVPPRGTRAAVMMEKEKERAQEASLRRR